MRTTDRFGLVLAGLLLCGMTGAAWADDKKSEDSLIPGLQTEVQITGQGVMGPNDKAKFEEYREIPQGASADLIWLGFENKDQSYFLDVRVEDASQDDMRIDMKFGSYGKWKLEFGMNRIPHRFERDAKTLFSGAGTDFMHFPDIMQSTLQAAGPTLTDSSSVATTKLRTVARLLSGFQTEAATIDEIGLQRDRYELNLEWQEFDPVTFGIYLKHEERYGGRPIGYGTGFGLALGLVEPIDYGTSEAVARIVYAEDGVRVAAEYGFEYFENRNDSFRFDNPHRLTPHTTTGAYSATTNSGSNIHRVDLWPSNMRHHAGISFGVDLPYETRVNAGFTYAWRLQEDQFLPYTSNTAMNTGAPAVSVVNGVVPFNAWDRANLPVQNGDFDIRTSDFTFGVSNRAIEGVDIRAKYRLYNYDNQSEEIQLPGFAIFDQVWENEEHSNELFQWLTQSASLDVGIKLPMNSRITPGYRLDYMDRDLRETDVTYEHTASLAFDTKPCNFIGAKASYAHSWRQNGRYEYSEPFGGDPNTRPPQLPYLRKYDEADRQQDKVNVQFTLYPMEEVTPTFGYTWKFDNYASEFGLKHDSRHAVNVGVEASPYSTLTCSAYSNWEWSENEAKQRQWNPGGAGDPYVDPIDEFSFSNWIVIDTERINTIGVMAVQNLMKDKLDFEFSGTHSSAGTHLTFDSPLGTTSANDANLRDLVDISDSDDSEWNTAKFTFKWTVRKNLAISFGYMVEDFDHEQGETRDYTPVGVNIFTGNYLNFLGMDVANQDYTAHTAFVSMNWKF